MLVHMLLCAWRLQVEVLQPVDVARGSLALEDAAGALALYLAALTRSGQAPSRRRVQLAPSASLCGEELIMQCM